MKGTSRLHTCVHMRQRDVQIPSHPQMNQPWHHLWNSGSVCVAELYTWIALLKSLKVLRVAKKIFCEILYGDVKMMNHLRFLLIDGGEH